MNTNELTEQNIIFSIISSFNLYLKIIIFLIIIFLNVFKNFKLKNNINLNLQKKITKNIIFCNFIYIYRYN